MAVGRKWDRIINAPPFLFVCDITALRRTCFPWLNGKDDTWQFQ